MAAIAEGKLQRRELEPLLGHIEQCAPCRTELTVASRSLAEEGLAGRSGGTRVWWIGVGAAAAAALIVLVTIRTWPDREARSSLAALVEHAPRSARVVEPRLSGGFPYARYSGPARAGDPATEAERLKLGGQAGIAIEAAARDDSPVAQHTAGVAYLLVDNPREAIARLRAAVARAPDDAAIWSDLAAAEYAAAVRIPAPSLLPEALVSIDRALRLDAQRPESLFNRALILERLGLTQQARTAWERYLAADPSSPWAVEARTHLRALPPARGDALFRRELPRLEQATAAGDAATAGETVRGWREQSRAWGEAEFLGRWGEAMQQSHAAEATRLLDIARMLGQALRDQSGEGLLADAVAAIDGANAATMSTLAEAHATYRRGRIAYSRGQPSAAEPDLRRAAALFARGGSPMARMARYYAANTRFDQNDISTAGQELEGLLAEAAPPTYIALGALVRWQLSLCRVAEGDAAGALELLVAAASALRRIDERSNLGFVESLLADTLAVCGRPDEAWTARIRSFEALSTEGRAERLLVSLASAVVAERRAGRPEAAMSLARVERDMSRDLQDEMLLATSLTRAALLSAELGDFAGAARLAVEVRAAAARVTDPALRSLADTHVELVRGAATLQTDPAAAAPSLAAAARAYETMGQHALVIECHLLRARAERTLGDVAAAARTAAEGVERFERFRVPLATAAVDEGVLEAGSKLVAEAIRLSLDRGDPALAFGYADRARVRFTDAPAPPAEALAAAVQARLAGSGAALVEMVVLPAETIVFSVDESGVTAARETIARETVAAMAARAAAGDHPAAAALYELLLRRAAALPRARTLIVVADPLLEALPFAALYDARAKRYLIERLPIILAESASSLRPAAPRPSPARLVAMVLPSGESTGSMALADTGAEVGDVAASYRAARTLPAAQATFAALKIAGRDADVIHLSGHTEEIGSGGTAALLFAGENGEARQRVAWKTIAGASFPRLQVAVLAACDTLRLPTRAAGARAPSLAGAFLAAGAHTAVGTLRPVGDRDARTLFRALHQHLGAGIPAATAVRNAQLEAIAEGTPPVVWSAMAVIGRDVPRDL